MAFELYEFLRIFYVLTPYLVYSLLMFSPILKFDFSIYYFLCYTDVLQLT